MSSSPIFSKLCFKKYTEGEVVATDGDFSFKKLSEHGYVSPVPPDTPIEPITITDNSISLSALAEQLGLKSGVTYLIACTSEAPSYYLAESEYSDYVRYTVK